MKNIKKPTRRKKATTTEGKKPRASARAKTKSQDLTEFPAEATSVAVATMPAAPPPPARNTQPAPANATTDEFSAGIFDIEERMYEPSAAPAVTMIEPLSVELKGEMIVVDEIARDAESLKADFDNASGTSIDDQHRRASESRSASSEASGDETADERTATGRSSADADATAGPCADVVEGDTDSDGEKRGRGRRRSRGRRRGRRGDDDRKDGAEGEEARSDRAAAPDRGSRARPARGDAVPPVEVGEFSDEVFPGDSTEDDTEDPSARERTAALPADTSRREMLINVSDPDEVRIALLRDGRLDELYIERAASVSNVGNIYKGRVTNVEPSIQAAFIDFGLPIQGFLHISDLHPNYFPESKGEPELVGRKTPRRQRPPIQSCLKRGQEVIVQVIKEGVGTKGPTLTTYVSLPGRFLVMMPGMEQLGVSRKVEDEEIRRKVRAVLGQLSLPKDYGFIVRTAGIDRNKRDLQRDLNYLTRLWDKVQARIKKEPAPATLYKESDLVIRTIRDVYDSNFERILVDNATVAQRVREFLDIASPKTQDVVELYEQPEPLFHRYGIESEIDKLYSKTVPLPCGGSLVIEPTEALVAIDVNSGRFRVHDNPEETAYRVNLEAADEIARQLRLRDLGGLIICDLIDMMQEKHKRAVERRLSDALRKHKERAKLLRISQFGILEMTRQRQRPSFAKNMFIECPRCAGSGRVTAPETASLNVMRDIRMASQREGVVSIDVTVSSAVGYDLLNRKRHQLADLERSRGQVIRVHPDPTLGVDEVRISCVDRRGREVPIGGIADTSARGSQTPADSRGPNRPATGTGPDARAARPEAKRGGRRRRGGRGR